jgi:hypothetical protein
MIRAQRHFFGKVALTSKFSVYSNSGKPYISKGRDEKELKRQ